MHSFLKTLVLITVLVILTVVFYMHPDPRTWFDVKQDTEVITFNEKTPLRVTILRDLVDLQRGLSGRESMEATQGLFFVFPEDAYHGIWMKDMRFSIDIVWVDSKGVVVDIAPNISPDSFPKIFEPQVPARYVIETNAHFAESFAIKVGNTVQLPPSVTQNLRR